MAVTRRGDRINVEAVKECVPGLGLRFPQGGVFDGHRTDEGSPRRRVHEAVGSGGLGAKLRQEARAERKSAPSTGAQSRASEGEPRAPSKGHGSATNLAATHDNNGRCKDNEEKLLLLCLGPPLERRGWHGTSNLGVV